MAAKASPKTHLAPPWQPGQSGNPAGRPQGARSKLNELALRGLLDDFMQHGPSVIAKVRERRPEAYLSAVVSLLPRQAQKLETPFTDLSDTELEQLSDLLSALRAKTVNELALVAPKKPKPETYAGTFAPLRTANGHAGMPADVQQQQAEGCDETRPEGENGNEVLEPLSLASDPEPSA